MMKKLTAGSNLSVWENKMKRYFLIIFLVVILTSITACEGGISGSVIGSLQKCSSNIDGGHCEGGFKKLSGTISEDMSMTRTGFHKVKG